VEERGGCRIQTGYKEDVKTRQEVYEDGGEKTRKLLEVADVLLVVHLEYHQRPT
jgi:hypothetical protein